MAITDDEVVNNNESMHPASARGRRAPAGRFGLPPARLSPLTNEIGTPDPN